MPGPKPKLNSAYGSWSFLRGQVRRWSWFVRWSLCQLTAPTITLLPVTIFLSVSVPQRNEEVATFLVEETGI
jgi:hypothetical protein